MMIHIRHIALALLLAAASTGARAQHTLGVTGGYGSSTARFYPAQETRSVWGMYNAGITWRYYTSQRFVGCFGIDLEWLQRGFAYAPYASTTEEGEPLVYYTRRFNSIMLPLVWQPHFYLARRHLRVYLEAALTFSYNFSSTYRNDPARDEGAADWEGDYHFKRPRDNRWGYGLMGGGGIAVLVGRIEVLAGVRYHFGYSDIVRNRNKYYDNSLDGSENPFWYSPLRSPVDNLQVRVGVAYRFAPDFKSWHVKPRKREKRDRKFDFRLD